MVESRINEIWRKLERKEPYEIIQAMYDNLLKGAPYIANHLRSVGAVDALKRLQYIDKRLSILKEEAERRREKAKNLAEYKRQQAFERFRNRVRVKDLLNKDFLGADTSFESSLAKEAFSSDDNKMLRIEYEREKIAFVKSWMEQVNGPNLDDEQAAAVAAVHGHLQVVARAGSGKTRTLVARALFLQKHCGVSPNEMLLLAFNRKAAAQIVERLTGMLNDHVPHVMTFHALAYALTHPEEKILSDGPGDEGQELSRVCQQIIDDHLQIPKFRHHIRDLMLAHFREDWERIIEGRHDKSKEEQLRYRRSLSHQSLRGNYVKSYGEKVIADFLFDHDVPYEYEYNHWWDGINYRPDFTIFKKDRAGIIIEYFGLQGDPDYDKISESKRIYWKQRPGWAFLPYYPYDMKSGSVDDIHARIKVDLEKLGIRCNRLSEDEIWHRIRDRAIDRFTKASINFIGRCRKRLLSPEKLDEMIKHHDALSSVESQFLRIGSRLYEMYIERLVATGEEDFDGLMQRAIETVNRGNTVFLRKSGRGDLRDLRYVFIDEFQDYSELFFQLSSAMSRNNPHLEFFCVGDDWQAINGFAGSELRFFRDFGSYFGNHSKLHISKNYRSSASIVDLGNALMSGLGLPSISGKDSAGQVIVADLSNFTPSLLERQRYQHDRITPAVLRVISKALDKNHDVVMLNRKNSLHYSISNSDKSQQLGRVLERYLDYIRSLFPKDQRERISISTAHKYKGLEKSVVIVLDAVARSYPLIHPSWAFSRIFGDSLDTITEEEKRLFYVALTRAEEMVVLITEKEEKSTFLDFIDQKMTISKINWIDYPPVSNRNDRLVVKVCNQKFKGGEPTYAIKDYLKAAEYKWRTSGERGWEKSFPAKGFDIELLKKEIWSSKANGIEVKIFDEREVLVAQYSIDDGNWNEIMAPRSIGSE